MAVLTAAQARLYIRGLTGSGEDTALDSLISRADAVFASYLGLPAATAGGVPTIEDVTYTMYLDGTGTSELRLPIMPIQSVTTLHDSTDRTYASASLIATADYTVFGDEGMIRLDDDGSVAAFSKGRRAVKVVAVVGFTAIPASIEHAVGMQVAHWYNARDHIGRTSVSQGGGSISVKGLDLLPEVLEALRPFRLTSTWMG